MDEIEKEGAGIAGAAVVIGAGAYALGALDLPIGEVLILTVPSLIAAITGFAILHLYSK